MQSAGSAWPWGMTRGCAGRRPMRSDTPPSRGGAEPLAFRSDSGAQGLFLDLGSVTLRQEGALVQPVSGGASLGHVRLLEHTAVAENRRPGQQLTVSARWQGTGPLP